MKWWQKILMAAAIVQLAVLGVPFWSQADDTITVTHNIKSILEKEVFCAAWLTCDTGGQIKTDLMPFGESRTLKCPGAPINRPKYLDGYCDDWPFADMYVIQRLETVMAGAKYKILLQGLPKGPVVFQPY